MKLTKILMAAILSISFASANDVLKHSMDTMNKGIEQVQYGFINNIADMIREGLKAIQIDTRCYI